MVKQCCLCEDFYSLSRKKKAYLDYPKGFIRKSRIYCDGSGNNCITCYICSHCIKKMKKVKK